ncbi:ABC transporter permease [Microvirga aerilata]|uniref:ABC transporter permease n=1 Tax=Microvirga aerilata TaxID=670292 RepID=A0A936ZAJ1_9HYPH|nr:ABC transporter permease [Microvirga aerilata]MBL0406162.1 ABC transporter permease [Microvirga aerilata]
MLDAAVVHRREMKLTLWISMFIIGLCTLVAIFSPWIMPHDPTEFVTDEPFGSPQVGIWLGSDYLGRDLFSRLIDGTRTTLVMALAATALAHLLGDTLGLLAALRGGWVDAVISRVADLILSLPKIIVGLVVVAALGPSIVVIVILAAIVYAAGVFRIARALGSDLVNMDFIKVAKSRGEGTGWILFAEILPHVAQPLAADFAIRMSFAILFMSSLSFLGLGVQPPLADWGGLVRENLGGLAAGSLVPIFPAIAIAVTSVALNLFVDSLDEHQRKQKGTR